MKQADDEHTSVRVNSDSFVVSFPRIKHVMIYF